MCAKYFEKHCSTKKFVCDLPHELPDSLRIRKLGNIRKSQKMGEDTA